MAMPRRNDALWFVDRALQDYRQTIKRNPNYALALRYRGFVKNK